MIQEIITKGEYRAPLFDKTKRLEQYAVTLPYEIRNEVDGIDIEQFLTNGILDFMNTCSQDDQIEYKDKIWIWAHALDSFITIEGFVNTDDEDFARELAEYFGYDCYFDLIEDETIYI